MLAYLLSRFQLAIAQREDYAEMTAASSDYSTRFAVDLLLISVASAFESIGHFCARRRNSKPSA
jgi:hypothetical protein